MSAIRSLPLALVLIPSIGFAAERKTTLTGTSLTIASPCAAEVTVQPDPALHGGIAMVARADHQEELDRLLVEPGAMARVQSTPDGCWRPFKLTGFDPTLRIVLRVPPATPIVVEEGGTGRYVLGDIGGPLHVEVSGAAQVQGGRVTSLTAELSGAARLRLTDISGPARLDMSGHDEVAIARLAAPRLDVNLSGFGSLTIASGQVGTARIVSSGFGTVGVDADVERASVDLSGAGRVHFARVTGTLTKDISGLGTVTVGSPAPE